MGERLAALEKERLKKLEALSAAAEAKATLARKKDEERRREEDRQAALRLNAESEAAYQLELQKAAEIKRKTKDFWRLDHLNERVLLPPHFPGYFGEHIDAGKGSWMPHGQGHFHYKHETILEGTFRKGLIHGNGKLRLEDGRVWEGEFKAGKIHGIGLVTELARDGEGIAAKREAIARDHVVICHKDEIVDGVQVELQDPTLALGLVGQPLSCNKVLASVMFHVKGWKYRCRFHDEVHPRERDVEFSSLRSFKVLHHLPKVYHISRFEHGAPVDAEPRYDYWSDVYGPYMKLKGPRLGIAGGRRTAEMRPHQAEALKPIARTHAKTDYKENSFESHMVGIGAAQEEEEIARRKELKKKQFEALIEKRRADAEAERLKAIEEEQARITAEDLAKAKAKAAEAEAQRKRDQEALAAAVAKAAEEYDAAHAEDLKYHHTEEEGKYNNNV